MSVSLSQFMNWFTWGICRFSLYVILCFPSLTGFTQRDKSLGPSMLLKMTFFYSFRWLSGLQHFDGQFPPYFSVDGHFGLCSVLDIVNNAVLKIWVHLSFQFWFSTDLRAGVGLPDHAVSLFSVLRNLHTAFFCGCTHPFPSPPTG